MIVAGWLFHYKMFTPGVSSPNNATVKLDPHRRASTRLSASRFRASWAARPTSTTRVTSPVRPSWSSKSPAQAAITT